MATATTTKPATTTAPTSKTPPASTAAKGDVEPAPALKKSTVPRSSEPVKMKRVIKAQGKVEWHPVLKTPPDQNKHQIVQAKAKDGEIDASTQEEMSSTRRARFVALNKAVRLGLEKMSQLSLAVAEALREIRDEELYLGTHKNFREYCLAEFQRHKSHVYALANAGAIQRDLDSAMADKSRLPKNERQLRPLTKLETPELRVQAWKRTLEIVGDKPVTEADVRKAVKEIEAVAKAKPLSIPAPAPALDWRAAWTARFKAHGYEDVFEQPFKWIFDVAGLYSVQHQLYVRFVDALNFNESAGSLALKQRAKNCLIVVNATSNAKPEGILFSTGKAPDIRKESFSPAFHFMAKQLDAVIAHEGLLYRAGALDGDSRATWTPAAYADLNLPDFDDANLNTASEG